jgi:hypothetical protein
MYFISLQELNALPNLRLRVSKFEAANFEQLTGKLILRLPSGNEAGANIQWIPGGKLPTGHLDGGRFNTEGPI